MQRVPPDESPEGRDHDGTKGRDRNQVRHDRKRGDLTEVRPEDP